MLKRLYDVHGAIALSTPFLEKERLYSLGLAPVKPDTSYAQFDADGAG